MDFIQCRNTLLRLHWKCVGLCLITSTSHPSPAVCHSCIKWTMLMDNSSLLKLKAHDNRFVCLISYENTLLIKVTAEIWKRVSCKYNRKSLYNYTNMSHIAIRISVQSKTVWWDKPYFGLKAQRQLQLVRRNKAQTVKHPDLLTEYMRSHDTVAVGCVCLGLGTAGAASDQRLKPKHITSHHHFPLLSPAVFVQHNVVM